MINVFLFLLVISSPTHAEYVARIKNLNAADQKIEAQNIQELEERLSFYKNNGKSKNYIWKKMGSVVYGYENKVHYNKNKHALEITVEDISDEVYRRKIKRDEIKSELNFAIGKWKSGEDLTLKEINRFLRFKYAEGVND